MREFELIPYIYAGDFPEEVVNEICDRVNVHYQDDVAHIDWEDEECFPKFQAWLLQAYGEKVKNYKYFAIQST